MLDILASFIALFSTMAMRAAIPALAIFGSPELADAAGFQTLTVPSNRSGPELRGAVWYPCTGIPGEVKFRFDTLNVAQDCQVTGEKLPLIIISHGVGGWFGNFHVLAEKLADAGFVVAAISHPRDAGLSDSRDPGDIASMTQRPADMTRLVTFMLGSWQDASRLDAGRIGFFGYSRGGFTGLALLGGRPDWNLLLTNCPTYPGNRFCEQIRASAIGPLTSDPRIKAAVVVDPAGGSLFTRAGLKDVTVPVQLWGSERGGDGLSVKDAATIAANLPRKPEFHFVANSGHFSFLPPCGPELAKLVADSEPEICADASNFDRVAFHKDFNAEILAFFRKQFMKPKPE